MSPQSPPPVLHPSPSPSPTLSPQKRSKGVTDSVQEEPESPSKRRRLSSLISEQVNNTTTSSTTQTDPLPSLEHETSHTNETWPAYLQRNNVLETIPENLVLKSTPVAAQESIEDRLAKFLPALRAPDPLVEMSVGDSTEESSSWGEEVETPRVVKPTRTGLVAMEQSLLGPGKNWKDAWFYNLFCEFKIFAQVVAMRGLPAAWGQERDGNGTGIVENGESS